MKGFWFRILDLSIGMTPDLINKKNSFKNISKND